MTEQNKEYKEQAKGINHLKNEANEGKISAQYQLYDAYYNGRYGVDKDEHIAEKYREQLQLNMPEKTLYIKSLTLQNFRRFKEVTLDLNNKLIVIVANNGAGKTTVLEAIAKLLSWFNNNLENGVSVAKPLIDSDIKSYSNEASISGAFQLGQIGDFQQKKIDFITTLEKGKNGIDRKSEVADIKKFAAMFRVTKDNPEVTLPLIIFYSINRMSAKSKSVTETKFHYDQPLERFTAIKKGMLDGSSFLDSFQFNYITLDNLATGNTLYKKSIEKLNTLITNTVTNISNLKVDRTTGQARLLATSYGQEVNMMLLSDGQKMFIALLGDIAWRLLILNPNLPDPFLGGGIVLIDEIELHLHPKWQQKIIGDLQKSFPNIQFIITTHSPQIISTVEKSCIRMMNFDGDDAVVSEPHLQTQGVESSESLWIAMNADPKPKNIEAVIWLEEFIKALENDNKQELDDYLEKIKKHFGETHPVFLDCESKIRIHAMKKRLRSQE